MENLNRRMDRFDAVVTEYLRANHKTVEYLAKQICCSPSTLWRYRKKTEYFKTAPIDVIATCFRLANISNENLRYILGLPTWKPDEGRWQS